MKIGYPCINRTLDCRGNKTFRLKSYSEERLVQTVQTNVDCLLQMLKFNVKYQSYFFRITSDLIPFASHPICKYDWQHHFRDDFYTIGEYIKSNKIRISMHPDQFILINSKKQDVVDRSIKELIYHAQVLDVMELDFTAKIQLHVGGVYGDKPASIKRFIKRYHLLPEIIKNRLVIENDDHLYCVKDCMEIYEETQIPILFDSFHHTIYNSGETISEAMEQTAQTWQKQDGIPMTDYSSQQPNEKRGKHAKTIDVNHFQRYLQDTQQFDFDIMLEIKDKEKSAIKAIQVAQNDKRFFHI